jgi:Phage capsid-like protein
MTDEHELRRTLSESAARQLANATKTRPQWSGITPRWLVSFLPWVPVEAGIYRLNRVKEESALTDADVQCSPARDRDADLPETFVDYEDAPREYSMNAVTTVLDVQTRVSDLYNHPYDQIQEQVRLLTEKVKEKQESELINNGEYGFLANAHKSMKIHTRTG